MFCGWDWTPLPRPPASAALRKGEKLEVWGRWPTRIVRVRFQGGSEVRPILAEGRELSRSRGSGREGDSLEMGQSLLERRGCVHETCNRDPSPQAFAGGTFQNSWRHCPVGPYLPGSSQAERRAEAWREPLSEYRPRDQGQLCGRLQSPSVPHRV